jgi:hypothetical protein
MNIDTVDMTESGHYTVNKDADMISVPNDMGNRHRVMVQEWIDAGNTPTAYVAPVKTWEENRQAEYPTIEELVVALYDTDDKAAIEKRRSDVKAKYPKP